GVHLRYQVHRTVAVFCNVAHCTVQPLYLGYGVLPAVLLALAAGIAVGALNGAIVAVVRLQPIVATLALFVGGRGLALVLAVGQLKQIHNPTLLAIGGDDVLGVPLIVLIAAVLAVAVG